MIAVRPKPDGDLEVPVLNFPAVQLDGRSISLESGRYMETIGWLSANLDHGRNSKKNLTFSRRYIDPNRVSFEVRFDAAEKEAFFLRWFSASSTLAAATSHSTP